MGVATAARPVFEARDLNKVYRTEEADVVALRHVDLGLMAGEFVVILGPAVIQVYETLSKTF